MGGCAKNGDKGDKGKDGKDGKDGGNRAGTGILGLTHPDSEGFDISTGEAYFYSKDEWSLEIWSAR